jgi:hypothetical protein
MKKTFPRSIPGRADSKAAAPKVAAFPGKHVLAAGLFVMRGLQIVED